MSKRSLGFLSENMDNKEAAKILLTKVILPTLDVWSDWQFGINLINAYGYDMKCSGYVADNHVYMGVVSLTPAILSALFHLNYWYHMEKLENGGSGRFKTLPIVFLQVYSPYRYLR